ncbi:MAG: hypothetical protein IPO42_16660 [Chitinophagaceae bacterium]|nr:hypothetical protein [Chitinophagaceae bacterium]
MKTTFTYYFMATALVVLFNACLGGNKAKKLPSLVETYSKKDKKPFGADIAYRQVAAMYSGKNIRDKRQNFKKTWQNISDTNALYICIAPRLFLNEAEAEAMMDYVYDGNSLFISAAFIDDILLKKIGCTQVNISPAAERVFDVMNNTGVNNVLQPGFNFNYYYHPFQNHFNKIDSSHSRVLGYNDKKKPNFIVHFYGKGKLFLQCEPRALSNYFLLKDNNYNYLVNALAFTQSIPENVYWDDHYNKMRSRGDSGSNFSTFGEIMKHPPLKFAFWLALILLLLYILFGGKRVQRIIELLKPNENTTVTFTETIGRLYLQKKDNKNIADKMITYFNEYIRNTYFLNTSHVGDDFMVVLSRKSGVEKDKVDTLYRTISATHGSDTVTDYQLLALHEQIQHFYKSKGKHT